ncbi:MAG: hypothetical protein GF350_16220 [Chitinivibrionales bacterium]|nr:hypothetical protein [Chitinivibrionales bacterium]
MKQAVIRRHVPRGSGLLYEQENAMNKKKKQKEKRQPVIRVRHICAAIFFVAASVLVPLFLVWKQVYITEASMKSKIYADSLTALRQETERLRLECESLAHAGRIEKLASNYLDLHYPESDRIIIIKPRKHAVRKSLMSGWEFFALIRKSLTQDKG